MISASSMVSSPNGAQGDRQGQADPQQPDRDAGLSPKLAQVDARGVAEQDQRQRRLGEGPHSRALA
jgi:hypothetical protein